MSLPFRLCAAAGICALGVRLCTAQITITDDLQRTVTLPRPAQRIVSLAPSITESLFAIGAGDRIAGVTTYCNYPPAAASKPRVGGMTTPSIESIVALHPDLVLVSMEGNLHDDFARLRDLRIPVAVSNPRTLDGIFRSLTILGRLTGTTDSASHLIAALRQRVDTIVRRNGTQPARTLLFVSLQPLITAGAGTFIDELVRQAGGVNLAAQTALTYPTLSREAVIAYDPDVLLVMSDVVSSTDAVTALYPEWARLTAVRAGRIYRLDADLISRPGPRAVDGLQLLSSLFHRNTP
ncbi:MAG TPA: cobalamin-binding protein [Bacteroidota bacterium]|nr:cobalamin-binding protein [Bacteroidota bacterium]